MLHKKSKENQKNFTSTLQCIKLKSIKIKSLVMSTRLHGLQCLYREGKQAIGP